MFNIEQMIAGYTAAALWSSTDEDGEPLDGLYSQDDLAPETLAQMRSDCADFCEANADSIAEFMAKGFNSEQVGHDFWLTRNGHGAGFWDRGAGSVGRALSDASKVYGSVDLYVGDDGRIYA